MKVKIPVCKNSVLIMILISSIYFELLFLAELWFSCVFALFFLFAGFAFG